MCFDKRPPFRPHSHSRHRPSVANSGVRSRAKPRYKTELDEWNGLEGLNLYNNDGLQLYAISNLRVDPINTQ
jgi:hypothetical protein